MSTHQDSQMFQQQLMNSLKDNNMQEALRSEMRLKLIEKLNKNKQISLGSQNFLGDGKGTKTKLTQTEKIVCSQMFQFQKVKNMTMTMAIFEPEVGESLFLENTQLLELMVKGTESYKEKIMNHQKKNNGSFLDFMVNEKYKENAGYVDSSCQTYDNSENLLLDEKLGKIEQFHIMKSSAYNNTGFEGSRENIDRMRREIKDQFEKDLSRETKRIREIEVNQVRESERLKYLEKYETLSNELNVTYSQKLRDLRSKEVQMQSEISEKLRLIEAKLDMERQKLLQQRDESGFKADILKKELETERKRIEDIREGNSKMAVALRQRENEIDSKYQAFDSKVMTEVEKVKGDEMKGIRVERELLQKKLRALDEELRQVQDLRTTVERLSKRNNEVSDDLTRERDLLIKEQDRNNKLQRDYDELNERWRIMNDHTGRMDLEVQKLDIRARNYISENDQLRVMNDELKQMLELRKLELARHINDKDNQLKNLKDQSDNYLSELRQKEQQLVYKDLKSLEDKYSTGGTKDLDSYKTRNLDFLKQFDSVSGKMKKDREAILSNQISNLELNDQFKPNNTDRLGLRGKDQEIQSPIKPPAGIYAQNQTELSMNEDFRDLQQTPNYNSGSGTKYNFKDTTLAKQPPTQKGYEKSPAPFPTKAARVESKKPDTNFNSSSNGSLTEILKPANNMNEYSQQLKKMDYKNSPMTTLRDPIKEEIGENDSNYYGSAKKGSNSNTKQNSLANNNAKDVKKRISSDELKDDFSANFDNGTDWDYIPPSERKKPSGDTIKADSRRSNDMKKGSGFNKKGSGFNKKGSNLGKANDEEDDEIVDDFDDLDDWDD